MSITVNPDADVLYTVLRAFLLNVTGLPGASVVQGQINRVPSPQPADYVVFTPIRRARLATNVDGSGDVVFTAAIAGPVMTVSALRPISNPIVPGANLFGVGVAASSQVISQLGGTPGGVGTYRVQPSQTVTSRTISAGAKGMLQSTEVVVQIDVHGPSSEDLAQIITTAFRDDYAVQFFLALSPLVTPLYADDPKQIPFVDDQSQWEDRWIVEARLEADPTVSVPQQYADSVVVTLKDVEAFYPV